MPDILQVYPLLSLKKNSGYMGTKDKDVGSYRIPHLGTLEDGGDWGWGKKEGSEYKWYYPGISQEVMDTLAKVGGKAWYVALHAWRLHKFNGGEPFTFGDAEMPVDCCNRLARFRGLKELEALGLVRVIKSGKKKIQVQLLDEHRWNIYK
jgi:hypothetical protein